MAFLFAPTARAEIVTCTARAYQGGSIVIKLDTASQLLFWGPDTPEPVIVEVMATGLLEISATSRKISRGMASLHLKRENGTWQFFAFQGDSVFQGTCTAPGALAFAELPRHDTTAPARMTSFTPASAVIGGILIGLSATLLLWTTGRVAGISGIVGGLLRPTAAELPWRVAFVAGLIAAPLLYRAAGGTAPSIAVTPPLPLVIIGGLLVGYGTQLGSGCTSGHGVCGLARLSPRSLVATTTFLVVALVTAFVTRHVLGGAP